MGDREAFELLIPQVCLDGCRLVLELIILNLANLYVMLWLANIMMRKVVNLYPSKHTINSEKRQVVYVRGSSSLSFT